MTAALLLAMIVAGLMSRTAQLGGQIVHRGVRKGFVPPSGARPEPAEK